MTLIQLTLLGVLFVSSSFSGGQDNDVKRSEFVTKLAQIREGDNKQKVKSLLGTASKVLDVNNIQLNQRPDVIRYTGASEVWCYGTNDASDFPTLGQLHFDAEGKVITTYGGLGDSIKTERIDENKIQELLRLINQMPQANGRKWNPAVVINITNAFVDLGKQDCYTVIREYIRVSPEIRSVYEQVGLLLTVLHEVPDESAGFPKLILGFTMLNAPVDPELIPRYPIHLLRHDVPIFLVNGFTYSGGVPGSAIELLEWHEANGIFRKSKIEIPEVTDELMATLMRDVMDLLELYLDPDEADLIARSVYSQLDCLKKPVQERTMSKPDLDK